MLYKGSTDWLNAIPMMEVTIKNSIEDNVGLYTIYIVFKTPIRMPVDMLYRIQGSITSV